MQDWAKEAQYFLWNIDAAFNSAQELAAHSPALNPLDYSVWDILQELVYERWRQPYANIQELEKAIRQKWNEIKDQTIKNAILQWKRHLAAVTKTGGGPIQHIFSWTLVKAADNWLILFGFSAFWHIALLCSVSWLKCYMSIWISVYMSMNVCSLKIYITSIYFILSVL